MDKISLEVRSLIRSSINIRNYGDAVSELVYNSLDANATSIAVRMDIVKHKIQVIDNGEGIQKDDMKLIGRRHMTSKCKTVQDLKYNIKTFGFRGESISSIVNISEKVTIESLYFKGNNTYSKVFTKGIHDEQVTEVNMRPSHGTTVTIVNFMYNLGVRQKSIDPMLEMEEIRLSLCRIALLHYYVSFTLRDDTDGKLVLKTHKSCSVREASGYLFDQTIGNMLLPVTVQNNGYSIEGYISKEAHVNKTFQYVYINKRYIKNCEMRKFCDELLRDKYGLHLQLNKNCDEKNPWPNFKRNFSDRKYPIFIMNIICPQSDYDITVMPDKSIVQFKSGDKVKETVKMFVEKFTKKIRGEEKGKSERDNNPKANKKQNMIDNKILKMKNVKNKVKEIFDKNAEEFGVSQMNNAVKGNPAKRRRRNLSIIKEHSAHSMNVNDAKTHSKEINVKCVSPKHKVNVVTLNHHKIRRKVIGKIGNKIKPSGDCLSNNAKKMRETPFILSQLRNAKTISKSNKDLDRNGGTKRNLKDVAVNVNILSRKVHHLKTRLNKKNCYSSLYQNEQIFVTKSKGNVYKKTTQSSVIHHVNFDSHKNFHLANQVGNNCNKLNNQYILANNATIHKDKFNEISKNSIFNQCIENLLNDNDLQEIFKIIKYKFVNNKCEKNNISKKKTHINVAERSVKKTCDMVRTIIPDKRVKDTVVFHDDVESPKRIDSVLFRDFDFADRVICNNEVMRPKQIKNSSVQTVLNLDHIEAMIQKCEKLSKSIQKYCHTPKYICLYDSAPNMRPYYKTKPSLAPLENIKCNDVAKLPMVDGKYTNDIDGYETSFSTDNRRNIDITSFTCMDNDVSIYFRSQEYSTGKNANCNIDPIDFLEIVQGDECGLAQNNDDKCIIQNNIEPGITIIKEKDRTSVKKTDENIITEISEVNNVERIEEKEQNEVIGVMEDENVIDINDKVENGKVVVIDETIEEELNDKDNLNVVNPLITRKPSVTEDKIINSIIESSLSNKKISDKKDNCSSSAQSGNSKSLSMFKSSDLDVAFVDIDYLIEKRGCNDRNELQNRENVKNVVIESSQEGSGVMESENCDEAAETDKNNYKDGKQKCLMLGISNGKENENAANNDVSMHCSNPTDEMSPLHEVNEWEVKTDSLGKVFYINNRTGMTLYENPECNSALTYKVFKRPNFVPKGLSPILKLGDTNWEFGNKLNHEEISAKIMREENEIIAKMKHGNFYYTEEAYENFVFHLQDNNFSDYLANENMKNILHNNAKRFKPDGNFRFNKTMLKDIQVINQVDKKFICAATIDYVENKKYVILFDQHAVHERVQLEKLITEFRSDTEWKSTSVKNPLRLSVNKHDVPLLRKYKGSFESIGITFNWKSDECSEIDITGLPSCFQFTDLNEEDSLLKLVNGMICEEIDVIRSTKGGPSRIPTAIMKVISSKACHSAIKFGTSLSKTQCKTLLKELSKCEVPFQCAHGRPALTILIAEDIASQRPNTEVKTLNFKNIKKSLRCK